MDNNTIKVTRELLAAKRLVELQSYIGGELSQKYFVEKAIRNMIYMEQPTHIEQNPINALAFLKELKVQKFIDMGIKRIDSL